MDIISSKNLDLELINELFLKTKLLKQRDWPKIHGKQVALLFFEPSTRTYYSFYTAAKRLGLTVLGMQNPKSTSLAKGESLPDTIRMFEGYGVDAFVIRHPYAGAQRLVAEKTNIPVINAGDNSNEHPTQSLLDLYTIWEEFKQIDGLKIGIAGDLKYGRTASSLSYILSNYDVEISYFSPDTLKIGDHVKKYLSKKNTKFNEYDISKIKEKLNELDVLYMTRIQKERIEDPMIYKKIEQDYIISKEDLEGLDVKIMHPLPRVTEINHNVDGTKNALYFKQAENGLYVRGAIFSKILGD